MTSARLLLLLLVGCTAAVELPADPVAPTPEPTPRLDPLPAVLISEVLADNHGGDVVLDGAPVDWVELFAIEAADLGGWGLSDDPDEPFLHTFADGTRLESGRFLVVPLEAFALSADGEVVVLTAADGREVDRLEFGPQREDVSFGRPQQVARTPLYGAGDTFAVDIAGTASSRVLPLGYDAGGGPEQNLALGRPTYQSSDGYGRTGAQAVDGDPTTFSHTGDADLEPWWEVDLGRSASIREVRILNRIGCCPERLYNLDVRVIREDGEDAFAWPRFHPVAEGTAPTDPGPEHVFALDAPVVGRFVHVAKTAVGGPRSTEWMSLAEVEVTGSPAAPFSDRILTDVEAEVRGVTDRVIVTIPPIKVEVGDGVRRYVLTVEADDAWRVLRDGEVLGEAGVPGEDGFAVGEVFVAPSRELLVEAINASADDADFFVAVEFVAEDIVTEDGLAFFRTPTPGAPNGPGFAGFVADPVVDPPRGAPDGPFTATVSTVTEGATVVYTLDGTAPTLENGVASEGAAEVRVESTTTLRAAAFRAGWEPSGVVTHTWLFLDDVVDQPAAPPGFPPVWDGIAQAPVDADYGMDPDVVGPARAELIEGLRSIPSLSIVMDPDDLFGAQDGIYVHSQQRGAAWERAASVELIDPDGAPGFATTCGVRVHGYGWRPHSNTRKHSLRLEFRERYGPTKLEYPLFPDAPVERFDSIVLRAQGSRGWQDFRDPEQSQYLRDTFARDTARDMGKADGHATYVHLYLNGLYWGLYNPVERPDADFGAEYFGGEPEDYDAINRRTTTNEAIDGTLDAYNQLLALADGPVETEAGYAAVLEMLDVDDLIDYMLIHQYTANRDGPERFNHNNMRGVRRRPDGRFRFFVWDMEYSLWFADDHINIDVDVAGSASHVYARLRSNPTFRARYAERAALHLEAGGALTADAALARYEARADSIFTAVLGESARWGDADRAVPYTRDVEWAEEYRRLTEEFFPRRTDVLIEQLRAAGLYAP